MQSCRSLQSLSILLVKGGHCVGDCEEVVTLQQCAKFRIFT
mgnify:CR=1 FL=1